jgi:hypothetical protein
MKSILIFILSILLFLGLGIGCDKESLPIKEEESVIEEPIIEAPVPDAIIPPIIWPPIEGPSAAVSIDSIRMLFIGKWKQIERLASAERPLAVQADTLIF